MNSISSRFRLPLPACPAGANFQRLLRPLGIALSKASACSVDERSIAIAHENYLNEFSVKIVRFATAPNRVFSSMPLQSLTMILTLRHHTQWKRAEQDAGLLQSLAALYMKKCSARRSAGAPNCVDSETRTGFTACGRNHDTAILSGAKNLSSIYSARNGEENGRDSSL